MFVNKTIGLPDPAAHIGKFKVLELAQIFNTHNDKLAPATGCRLLGQFRCLCRSVIVPVRAMLSKKNEKD